MRKRLTKNKEVENKKTSGISGSYNITRPLTHIGKTDMGKGLGERALYQ